jgi:hypothetical protein
VWYKVKRLPNDYADRTDVAFLRVTKNNTLVKQYAVPAVDGSTWKSIYVSFVAETGGQYYLELVIEKPGTVILWDDISLVPETVAVGQSFVGRIASVVGSWFSRVFGVSVATADTGLWCSTPGADAVVEPRADGVSSVVRISPKKVLDAKATYKIIAIGDSTLDDNVVSGITNYHGVAMNGKIVHQWMFTTADKLCTLDDVRLDLSCVRNGTCQNNPRLSCSTDRDCGPASDAAAVCNGQEFKGDECAAFRKKDQTTSVRATARSNAAGGQEIQPVDGYRWAWNFNTSAVETVSISKNTTNPSAPVRRVVAEAQHICLNVVQMPSALHLRFAAVVAVAD